MKELLYGKDATEGIVGVIPHDDESVMVFIRRKDGTVRQYIEKYWSMFLTNSAGAQVAKQFHTPEWAAGRHLCVHLKDHEHGHFTHLILSKSRKNNGSLRKEVNKSSGKIPTLTLGSAATQYLLQTGRTMFKGMSVHDARRMQIDIETLFFDGQFSNADNDADEIYAVAVSDNHGFKKVLHTSKHPDAFNDDVYQVCKDERDLIKELMRIILMRDPDIIEGHNFFGFDMPYIMTRAKKCGIKFGIGRNKRVPYSRAGRKAKFAEREIEYTTYNIAGRHIVDTYFLVCEYDVYKRAMPSYGLKAAAKFFDIAKDDREYVPGHLLTETWFKNPNRVLRYALDDGEETRGLSEKLMPSTLAMAQMVPNTLQAIHTGGVSRAIELLFLREYIKEKTAIPKPERYTQAFGGLTSVVRTGRIKKLWYIDVASLYPSIMLNYNVAPECDVLGIFQRLLRLCTDLRLETKHKMNQYPEDSDEYAVLDAEQSVYKKNINSFYGYLGFMDGLFNDISEADRVAVTGQSILVRMIKVCESLGCTLIECDTDGILVQPPVGREEDDALKFVKEEVEPKMPKGIKLDLDGVFEWMLSYKSKNYALIDSKGKIKIKGGAFKNRGIEGFGRDFMKKAIGLMLRGEWEAIEAEFQRVRQDIINKRLPLEKFMVRKNLKMSLEEYEDSLKDNGGKSNRAAQYELWKKDSDAFNVGDAIYYWVEKGNRKSKNPVLFADAKHVKDYEKGKEHSGHYLKRFEKIVSKFALFFDESSFGTIFDSSVIGNQQTLFPTKKNFDAIKCPVIEVKTVADLEREMQRHLAQYENIYN